MLGTLNICNFYFLKKVTKQHMEYEREKIYNCREIVLEEYMLNS